MCMVITLFWAHNNSVRYVFKTRNTHTHNRTHIKLDQHKQSKNNSNKRFICYSLKWSHRMSDRILWGAELVGWEDDPIAARQELERLPLSSGLRRRRRLHRHHDALGERVVRPANNVLERSPPQTLRRRLRRLRGEPPGGWSGHCAQQAGAV